VLLVFSIFLNSTTTPIENVRNQFPNIETLEQTDSFLEALEKETSAEAKGYRAAMLFMKSRFVKNPFSKLKYFKEGKQLLDDDIAQHPSNIEIRYIRFLMQKQIPAFLGYNDYISEDFGLITSNIIVSDLPKSFKIEILNNMLLVDNLTAEEQGKMNKIKSQL
jgi:hypothetical protein